MIISYNILRRCCCDGRNIIFVGFHIIFDFQFGSVEFNFSYIPIDMKYTTRDSVIIYR